MADTGAPWNIPYVAGTDLVADWPTDNQTMAEAIADSLTAASGPDTLVTITATDLTWSVPTLINPVVRVTCVGGGGGGGGSGSDGTAGSTTSFGAYVSATGGAAGQGGTSNYGGTAGTTGLASGNGGMQAWSTDTRSTSSGLGGSIVVGYVDLTGVSTVAVTIGAGGAGGNQTAGDGRTGGAGGDGVVIIEYR